MSATERTVFPGQCWELERERQALEAENAALRLHEDLLMNVVRRVYRWSDHVYDEGNAEDWYEIAMIRVQELQRSLKDLTESGFPWSTDHGLPLPGAGEDSDVWALRH